MARRIQCPTCNGSGKNVTEYSSQRYCGTCKGEGTIVVED